MADPRQATVNVTYTSKKKPSSGKKKKTVSVMQKYDKGFSYVDSATGESDTISITLANVDMRWNKAWFPKKGDKLTAKIVQNNWKKAGVKKVFNCGKFCLDDLSFSGPFPLECTIGGVSSPDGNAFRCTARTKTWKGVTLKELASGIAKKYHMKLNYTGGVIKLGTIEQNDETDSSFLSNTCSDYGMAIKIYSGKIVIYNMGIFEAKTPVTTLRIAQLQDWSYSNTLTGTYTGATIKYTVGDSDKELKCKVGYGKRILAISDKVDSLADAKLKACGKVNKENQSAVTMSCTIMANMRITAGCTVKIAGLNKLSGKYFVDKVTHNIAAEGKYTMDLELHKVQKRITA